MNKKEFKGYDLTLVVLQVDRDLCVKSMYGQLYKDCPKVTLLEAQSFQPFCGNLCDSSGTLPVYVKLRFRCFSLRYMFKILQFTLYQFYNLGKPIQVD